MTKTITVEDLAKLIKEAEWASEVYIEEQEREDGKVWGTGDLEHSVEVAGGTVSVIHHFLYDYEECDPDDTLDTIKNQDGPWTIEASKGLAIVDDDGDELDSDEIIKKLYDMYIDLSAHGFDDVDSELEGRFKKKSRSKRGM